MEKNIKIDIPEGYNDAVFDKETNEIKFIKGSKLGDKVTINGVEGYVLEVDDAGEPIVLCSEFLGDMPWCDAMKKVDQGPWHLPTVEEWKKYYKIVRELDNDRWRFYWTSTESNLLDALYIGTYNCNEAYATKALSFHVRAFAFVGKKKAKLGDKVTIDGVEGYILEIDDAGEPTVLCSESLGIMSWYDAMTKANWALWHLPTVVEFNKYYEIVRELDNNNLFPYWTSSTYNSFRAYYVYPDKSNAFYESIKTELLHVRVFAFVGSKKESKPRSWEEYRKQVCNTSCFSIGIVEKEGRVIETNREGCPQVNEVNTKEEAKAIVALCKLIQLRDAWWGDWKPDWMDSNIKKYGIFVEKGELLYNNYFAHQNLFVFPTPEMRNEFLETFRDLLEEAKILI